MRRLLLVLALAPLACAEEDMDALWRDACQWEVGSAIPSVHAAREKLIAAGAASLDYIIPSKLDTADGLVVRAIEEVVVKIGGDAAERLRPCLDAESANVRRVAASLLGKLGAKEATPRIIELLKDKDARGGALEALGALKATEGVPAIADLMRTAEKERARIACLATLAAIGGDEALAAILSALSDKGAAVRFAAQFALEKLKAVDALRSRLSDADARVRLHAIHALGRIGSPAACGDVRDLLDAEDPIVRGYAVEALMRIRESTREAAERVDGSLRVLFANLWVLPFADVEALRPSLTAQTHPFVRGKLEAALRPPPGTTK